MLTTSKDLYISLWPNLNNSIRNIHLSPSIEELAEVYNPSDSSIHLCDTLHIFRAIQNTSNSEKHSDKSSDRSNKVLSNDVVYCHLPLYALISYINVHKGKKTICNRSNKMVLSDCIASLFFYSY